VAKTAPERRISRANVAMMLLSRIDRCWADDGEPKCCGTVKRWRACGARVKLASRLQRAARMA
jgi:hypothetical protein